MEALNLNTMAELEKDIEATLAAKIEAGRGCFGTILFNANDDVTCGACDLFAACEEAHASNRLTVLKGAELELEAEEAKLAAPEPAPEPVAEPETVVEPEPVPEPADIDVSALTVKTFKTRKIDFDWNTAIHAILAKRPTLYKDAAAIVRGMLHADFASSAYNYCNKILTGMANTGAIEWAPKGKTITWLR